MSLSKTFYPLLSTGSREENPSGHDWKIVESRICHLYALIGIN